MPKTTAMGSDNFSATNGNAQDEYGTIVTAPVKRSVSDVERHHHRRLKKKVPAPPVYKPPPTTADGGSTVGSHSDADLMSTGSSTSSNSQGQQQLTQPLLHKKKQKRDRRPVETPPSPYSERSSSGSGSHNIYQKMARRRHHHHHRRKDQGACAIRQSTLILAILVAWVGFYVCTSFSDQIRALVGKTPLGSAFFVNVNNDTDASSLRGSSNEESVTKEEPEPQETSSENSPDLSSKTAVDGASQELGIDLGDLSSPSSQLPSAAGEEGKATKQQASGEGALWEGLLATNNQDASASLTSGSEMDTEGPSSPQSPPLEMTGSANSSLRGAKTKDGMAGEGSLEMVASAGASDAQQESNNGMAGEGSAEAMKPPKKKKGKRPMQQDGTEAGESNSGMQSEGSMTGQSDMASAPMGNGNMMSGLDEGNVMRVNELAMKQLQPGQDTTMMMQQQQLAGQDTTMMMQQQQQPGQDTTMMMQQQQAEQAVPGQGSDSLMKGSKRKRSSRVGSNVLTDKSMVKQSGSNSMPQKGNIRAQTTDEMSSRLVDGLVGARNDTMQQTGEYAQSGTGVVNANPDVAIDEDRSRYASQLPTGSSETSNGSMVNQDSSGAIVPENERENGEDTQQQGETNPGLADPSSTSDSSMLHQQQLPSPMGATDQQMTEAADSQGFQRTIGSSNRLHSMEQGEASQMTNPSSRVGSEQISQQSQFVQGTGGEMMQQMSTPEGTFQQQSPMMNQQRMGGYSPESQQELSSSMTTGAQEQQKSKKFPRQQRTPTMGADGEGKFQSLAGQQAQWQPMNGDGSETMPGQQQMFDDGMAQDKQQVMRGSDGQTMMKPMAGDSQQESMAEKNGQFARQGQFSVPQNDDVAQGRQQGPGDENLMLQGRQTQGDKRKRAGGNKQRQQAMGKFSPNNGDGFEGSQNDEVVSEGQPIQMQPQQVMEQNRYPADPQQTQSGYGGTAMGQLENLGEQGQQLTGDNSNFAQQQPQATGFGSQTNYQAGPDGAVPMQGTAVSGNNLMANQQNSMAEGSQPGYRNAMAMGSQNMLQQSPIVSQTAPLAGGAADGVEENTDGGSPFRRRLSSAMGGSALPPPENPSVVEYHISGTSTNQEDRQ